MSSALVTRVYRKVTNGITASIFAPNLNVHVVVLQLQDI